MIVRINQDLCKACGICGRVCPRHIPVTIENENKKITMISPERINLCMQCGPCVAVCPKGKSNEILRDCPVLLLFHSPIFEPVGSENCLIAAFHAIMMAQVMKIGTCFNDLIPPMCNRVSEIRNLLDLPSDREVYASITMGYPKYKFKRVIPRKLAEVRYLK